MQVHLEATLHITMVFQQRNSKAWPPEGLTASDNAPTESTVDLVCCSVMSVPTGFIVHINPLREDQSARPQMSLWRRKALVAHSQIVRPFAHATMHAIGIQLAALRLAWMLRTAAFGKTSARDHRCPSGGARRSRCAYEVA
eukprot:TRINITY_DN9563_c0_g1_i1.p2 TRINITY_DN9563_c0_g1~~TRINITY_DN9563_c0_g1_i1.p2  ORF type:complete len:141 (-),score=2.26 TRINITY_DN9563_c0_g1_i1:663-1085(-)